MGGTPLRPPGECLPAPGWPGLLCPAHPSGHLGTGGWGALRLGRDDTSGGENAPFRLGDQKYYCSSPVGVTKNGTRESPETVFVAFAQYRH